MEQERWCSIFWDDKWDELDSFDLNSNEIHEGILRIKPPFAEITLADGFWQNLNNKLGTLFDYAEEEEIAYALLPNIVNEMKWFCNKTYNKDGYYNVKIAIQVQPIKKEITKNILFEQLRYDIEIICNFLVDANKNNKNITVML